MRATSPRRLPGSNAIHWRRRVQLVFAGKLLAGDARRGQVGQRMADELRRNAALAIKLLFEGKDHQHLANVLAHALDAALLPRPQLRADVVDDGHAALVQLARQAQVEVGEVDEHGGVRTASLGFANHLAKAAIDRGNVLDDLDDADLGDLSRIDQQIAAGGAHLLAAHAEELDAGRRIGLGDLPPQSLDQLCAVEFAGGFARRDQNSHQ